MWPKRSVADVMSLCVCVCVCQVRKTLDATMQTLQDMLTVEDFDVSEAFQHSQSTESVKSASSDSYMSKANISKRRANQHETEGFYFTVSCHTHTQTRYAVSSTDDSLFFFFPSPALSFLYLQKYKEYLNGSNLIVKLEAKHELLKQTLGEGRALCVFIPQMFCSTVCHCECHCVHISVTPPISVGIY